MKANVFAALAIMVALSDLGNKVYAQSPAINAPSGNITSSGNSLTGIQDRTAEDDYSRFFYTGSNTGNRRNNISENYFNPSVNGLQINEDLELFVNQPLSAPSNPILNPRTDQFDSTNGVQVQVDLTGRR